MLRLRTKVHPARLVRPSARSAFAALGFSFCLLFAGDACAATAGEKAAAREAAQAGIEAFKNEQYQEAISLLSRAEKVLHAPPHLLYMGRAHIEQGSFVQAREILLALVNEELKDGAPKSFRDSQTIAKELLEEIEPLIAKLTVRVEGADESVRVFVDDVEVPATLLGLPYPVDPGDRILRAEAGELKSEPVAVTVGEGDTQEVVLRIEGKPKKPPIDMDDEESESEEKEPAPAEPEKQGVHPLVPVGFATAAIGIGVGSVTGIMSLNKASKTQDTYCDGNACEAGAQDGIDSTKTLATVSNIGFAVGAVGLGLGIYGLVAGKSQSPAVIEQAGLRPQLRVETNISSGFVDARWVF